MTDSTPDFGSHTDFYTFAPEVLAIELPDFEIQREVGKGSMGIVYEAIRTSDGSRVALKILPPSLTLTERALARFLREAELMTKVRHPAIVSALAHGRQGRLHYFVMEFVDGVTAEERIQVGPLPIRQAAEIACQVARALQVAHDRGVVHRDIKPSNLMLRDDGRVAITDFGLARETGTGSMTESGTIVGTPMYMPPEQVLGDREVIGTRADVYGLGATLYHLVTGQPPFSGPTAQSVLKAVLDREPTSPRRLRADLPRPLEAIIATAMDKEPARRYGSAEDMADDLDRFLRGERVHVRTRGPLLRAYRAATKRPLLTGLVTVVVALGVLAFSIHREHRWEQLRTRVQEAEGKVTQASALRDDQLRPLSQETRRSLLDEAIRTTSEAIDEDPGMAFAHFVRGQALHRTKDYTAALRDLDEAERLNGRASAELLYVRIDTLRNLPDHNDRLLVDLTTLLKLNPGTYTRSLVADYLLDMAAHKLGEDRTKILDTAALVLERVDDSDARAAVARARLHELRGELGAAELAMADASAQFRGDPVVHYHAAQMYRRLGFDQQSRNEAVLAQMLDPLAFPDSIDPSAEPAPEASRLDVNALEGFLHHVDELMHAMEPSVDGEVGGGS